MEGRQSPNKIITQGTHSIYHISRVSIRFVLIRRQERTYDFADGEGFEPPVFLEILRFSRPTLSTAQTSIPRFCSIINLFKRKKNFNGDL